MAVKEQSSRHLDVANTRTPVASSVDFCLFSNGVERPMANLYAITKSLSSVAIMSIKWNSCDGHESYNDNNMKSAVPEQTAALPPGPQHS